jgi:metallo-beta-lactamase family protein
MLIFTGFQAGGTRGEAIVGGAPEVKIHGEYWPIRAEVLNLDMLSAHADRDELLSWLENLARRPKTVFVTHGEAKAADSLRRIIEEKLKVETVAPEPMQEVELD